MGRYGIDRAESCVETKKDLKNAIRIEKKKLKDFMELSENMDMTWEHRQQAIGSLYAAIYSMKRRLKEHYGRKK